VILLFLVRLLRREGDPSARAAALATVLLFGAAAPSLAQGTRTEQLEQRRAERARELQPYKPGKIEATLTYLEQSRLIERWTSGYDGWYPRVGSVTRGGGFAGGAGYRQHFGRHVRTDVSGAASIRNYRALDLDVALPYLAERRLEVGARAQYRFFPEQDYYGMGPESIRGDRVSYLQEHTDVSARAALHPLPWLETGIEVGWLSLDIGSGRDPRFPSIEQRFSEQAGAPGLAAQPDFLRRRMWVGVDYRDQPGNARSGGLYTASWGDFSDRDTGRYSFGRFDAEVRQYFPIFDKKRLIAVRALFIYTNNQPGGAVPFYMLPTLGGSNSLRAYRNFRFHDENALLLNAEYRWEAFSGMDMALFFDAGEVRHSWRHIDLKDLNTSYGIGFRFNTYKSVFLRADVGFGGEGTRYFVAFGPIF
jgi:outer membrane protein assembly factor BamA